jgi:hypothetical protein
MFTISQSGDTVHILFRKKIDGNPLSQIEEEIDAVVGFKGLKEMNVVADVSSRGPSSDDMDFIVESLVPSLKEMGAKDIRII